MRHVHSNFQSEFSTECDLVFPLSVSSILPFLKVKYLYRHEILVQVGLLKRRWEKKNDSNYDGNSTARHCLSGTYEISRRWIFVGLSVQGWRKLVSFGISRPEVSEGCCACFLDSRSSWGKYQEYFLGVKMAVAKGWQPYLLHVPIVLKSGSLNLLEPPGPVQACNRIALPCLFPGDQSAGVWCWPHAPSSAEVKERVELYLYSSSGSSWPFYHRGESLNNLVF